MKIKQEKTSYRLSLAKCLVLGVILSFVIGKATAAAGLYCTKMDPTKDNGCPIKGSSLNDPALRNSMYNMYNNNTCKNGTTLDYDFVVFVPTILMPIQGTAKVTYELDLDALGNNSTSCGFALSNAMRSFKVKSVSEVTVSNATTAYNPSTAVMCCQPNTIRKTYEDI